MPLFAVYIPICFEDLFDPIQKRSDFRLLNRLGSLVALWAAVSQNLLQGLPVHPRLANDLSPGNPINQYLLPNP